MRWRLLLLMTGLLPACRDGGGGGGDDADPLTRIEPGPKSTLSVGNESGQDEDPSLLVAADGSLHAAWYSNRNGTLPSGQEDKEVFLVSSYDGRTWTEPAQVTSGAGFAFYPSLAQSDDGDFHVAWFERTLLPYGCNPSVDCFGHENRILYKRTADPASWLTSAAETVTLGPGDWLPSLVHDRAGDRMLAYFAAIARDDDGDPTLSETRTRLFVSVKTRGGSWGAPTLLAGVNDADHHNTYPFVLQDGSGAFWLVWTRYPATSGNDILQVIVEPATDTLFATSTDGISWTAPVMTSDSGAGPATDVFPTIFVDREEGSKHVAWLTTDFVDSGSTVEIFAGGTYPDAAVARPEIEGYTGKIVETATPGVFWGAWVGGDDPTQKIEHRFFTR